MRTKHQRKRHEVKVFTVPDGWIEETPGVYIAKEPSALTLEETSTLAQKVGAAEKLLERIDEKEYLIFYADEDLLEAESDKPTTHRSDGLIRETVETINVDDFESEDSGDEIEK